MNAWKLTAATGALFISLATHPLFAKTMDSANSHQANATITNAETGTLATIAAIDKNEILLSIIASNKKSSTGVADFAKMMIDQHGSNLTQILEMAHNMHITSLKGGESEAIKTQGMKETMALIGLQDKQFDQTYVNAMVKGHEAALKLIDDKLMKTAKSDEIKTFLTDTRKVVEHHLEAAKKLQEDMKS